ncbi:Uncharacterised protein [Vibrio cholerae]|nr:Uncharacterised protein [Vibrio cholerae]
MPTSVTKPEANAVSFAAGAKQACSVKLLSSLMFGMRHCLTPANWCKR